MADKRMDEVAADSIPEVKHFIEVQTRFEAWKKQNAPFFDFLEQMGIEFNEALSAAHAACKRQQVTCGPIVKYQESTSYDWDAMYDVYGRDAFLELGGTLETIQKRGGDKKRVDFAIDTGRIDADRAKLVRKKTGKFKKPETISTP